MAKEPVVHATLHSEAAEEPPPASGARVLAWPEASARRYTLAVARALSRMAGGTHPPPGDGGRARALAGELLRLDPPRRRVLIHNGRRYRSLPVCERILDASLERDPDDPAGARELAELGLDLATRIEPPPGAMGLAADLEARAWACIANSHRLSGEPRRAALAFRQAEARLAEGTGDPLAEAEILRLRALLAEARGAWDTAEVLLDREIALCEAAGQPGLGAKALLQRVRLAARCSGLHLVGWPEDSAALAALRRSSSASVLGQSPLSRSDSARSASSRPPVWQPGQ